MRFLVFSLIFLATELRAAEKGHWAFLPDEKVVALHESGIRQLAQRYPGSFKGFRLDRIEYAAITVSKRRWRGPSICPSRDPRLEKEFVYADIRERPVPGEPMTALMGNVADDVDDRDPCLGDRAVPGRWVVDQQSRREYRSPDELAEYLEKHRAEFPDAMPGDFVFVKELDQRSHWEGATLCPPGDPRLFRERHSEEVALKVDEGMGGGSDRLARDEDPCGGGA